MLQVHGQVQVYTWLCVRLLKLRPTPLTISFPNHSVTSPQYTDPNTAGLLRLFTKPERIAGGVYTIRSDVWSSGLTLLTFAQGRFPYPDDLDGIIELVSFLQRTDPPKLMDEDPRDDGTGGVRWSPAMKDFIALW